MKLNTNYSNISDSYLFSEIARKVAAYQAANPDKKVLRLGIGDVTLPLAPAVISALHGAVDEMADKATFRGYGPEQGYAFLKDAIAGYYAGHGAQSPTSATFSICSRKAIRCSFPTPYIPYMWIPT